jgi:hypothetical protein
LSLESQVDCRYARALKRGGPPLRIRRRTHYTKLQAYLGKVDELLAAGVWNAQVIYREIQALGYAGKVRMLPSMPIKKRVRRGVISNRGANMLSNPLPSSI